MAKAQEPQPLLFGWVPFEKRTPEATARHNAIVAAMPRFGIRGTYRADKRRYPLWEAGKVLFGGKFLRYNWQQTGSCVGAGGGNAAKTLMSVEIALGGQAEEYKELWWPFTYGVCRGNTSEGDGANGSDWADAICKAGIFAADIEGLPAFEERQGWIALPSKTEYRWSTTRNIDKKWFEQGLKHLVKTAAPMRNADDCTAALINGYPLTQASNFGFRRVDTRGTPPVQIVGWDWSWPHQTFLDEYWDHPTEGELYRWGNNWGPTGSGTVGPPTAGEPGGGAYITKKTLESICRNGEVYALSAFEGFPARELDWYI